ncbi:L-arabinose-binding periplasmic protein [Escherichia coli]|uniref:L-arabinose-binding periplasmic protein n=1 Tax=Escherichia coli TaxID=562 RepID=A0A484X6X0_ECOLX|nr:L-arabinose-binding periplasmic protein [Escherichia coli]
MHKFTKALAAIGLAAVMSQSAMAGEPEARFPGEATGRAVVPDRMEVCR